MFVCVHVCCITIIPVVDVEDLRHLSTTLSTMASEKQKAKVSGDGLSYVGSMW